jgi:hypothetical protein
LGSIYLIREVYATTKTTIREVYYAHE